LSRVPASGPEFSIAFNWITIDFNQNTRFYVYKNGMQFGTPLLVQEYTDLLIQPGADYVYQVASFNIYSTFTTPKSANFTFHAGPSAPGQPTAVTVSTNSITFQWTTPTIINQNTIIIGYKISRNNVLLTGLYQNAMFYSDTGLNSNSVYEYEIQALVIDENNVTINGEIIRGAISTTSSQEGAIIGAAVGASAAFLIILFIVVAIYRKLKKVKAHVEDIAISGVEQNTTEFTSAAASTITESNSSKQQNII